MSSRPGTQRSRMPVGMTCALPLLLGACSGYQSALNPQGSPAEAVSLFFWVMVAVACVIVIFVVSLLLIGTTRARNAPQARPLSYAHSRNLVLLAGVVIPAMVLLTFVASSASLDRRTATDPEPALTIEVVGRQWWWEVHYLDEHDNRIVTTANEIHIPTGLPVRFHLKSIDVIHSFWVPNLNGKTDLIPDRTNTSWVQAEREGVYRGQCAEFCGAQHARMAFVVVAHSPPDFERWLAGQRAPSAVPTEPSTLRGQQVFLASQCVMCHTIRGTTAAGRVAPDLTHFGSRRTIAAASTPNTRGHLAGWISDPQSVKPGNFMPPTKLPGEDLEALVDYLHSLQ